MAKTSYTKKIKNGKLYYFYRLRHKNLTTPKDIYAPSVKELDKKLKGILNKLDNDIVENKTYILPFFQDWLFNVHCINKKASTMERYEGLYRIYIKNSNYFNKIQLQNIDLQLFQKYYNKLIKEGTSVNIVRNLHKLIAPFIRYAYNNNLIIKDFSKGIVLPTESEEVKLSKEKKVHPFTLEEQMKFIKAVRGHDLEVLFITALNTGMRKGELLALTWNNIDFKNKTITVNKSVKHIAKFDESLNRSYEYVLQTPKTEKSNRVIPIPDVLVDYLKRHEIKYKENKLRVADLYDDNKIVFCNQFGRYLDGSFVLKKYKNILKDNGMELKSFHDLRHTYATRLFELGESPKTVQTLLGHSNLSITLDTYTHVLDRMKVAATSKLNELYSSMGM